LQQKWQFLKAALVLFMLRRHFEMLACLVFHKCFSDSIKTLHGVVLSP
jgi:hypothetical protein